MKKLFLLGLIALFTIVACQQNEELTTEDEITIEVAGKEELTPTNDPETLTILVTYISKDISASRDCFINSLNLQLISYQGSKTNSTIERLVIKRVLFDEKGSTNGSSGGGGDLKTDNEAEEKVLQYLNITQEKLQETMDNCHIQSVISLDFN